MQRERRPSFFSALLFSCTISFPFCPSCRRVWVDHVHLYLWEQFSVADWVTTGFEVSSWSNTVCSHLVKKKASYSSANARTSSKQATRAQFNTVYELQYLYMFYYLRQNMLWWFSRLLNFSPGDKFLFSWQNAVKYNNKYAAKRRIKFPMLSVCWLNFIALLKGWHFSCPRPDQCVENLVLCTSHVLVAGGMGAVAQEIEWVI